MAIRLFHLKNSRSKGGTSVKLGQSHLSSFLCFSSFCSLPQRSPSFRPARGCHGRRAQGRSRMAVACRSTHTHSVSRPLLDGPEHGGRLWPFLRDGPQPAKSKIKQDDQR